jgi:uncharacterized glyoxalase superfamily protein PhnB
VRLVVEGDGGAIVHSELVYGEALVMVGGSFAGDRPGNAEMASPRQTRGINTGVFCIFVDDPDAHCAQARAAGAEIFREPKTEDYGPEYWADRGYGARDPEGHLWFFMQRARRRVTAQPPRMDRNASAPCAAAGFDPAIRSVCAYPVTASDTARAGRSRRSPT